MQQFRQPGFPQNVAQRSHAQAPRRGGIGTYEFAFPFASPLPFCASPDFMLCILHVAHTGHNLLLSLHFASQSSSQNPPLTCTEPNPCRPCFPLSFLPGPPTGSATLPRQEGFTVLRLCARVSFECENKTRCVRRLRSFSDTSPLHLPYRDNGAN